ncbi:PDZ domain-containing protein [Gaopeijia maritima]|uniref:PDZ domain-containing protein n=1 Tax=Gaopeijia maritima TaxID=3119007 RepID=A0ABU9E9W8_9BACT
MRSRAVLALLGLAAGAATAAPVRAAQTVTVGARAEAPLPDRTPAPGSGWLGVRSELTVQMRADGSNAQASQLTITDVYRGGPAWAAGIRPGDVVVGLNGLPLRLDRFQSLAQRLVPGDPVALTVRRGARQFDLSLEASARPGAEVLGPQQLQIALDSTRVAFLARLDSVERTLPSEMPFRVELKRIEADSVREVEVRQEAGVGTWVIRTGDGVFEWTSTGDSRTPQAFTAWAFHTDSTRGRGPLRADSLRVVVSTTPDRVARPPAPNAVGVVTPRSPETERTVRPLAPYVAGLNRVAGAEFTPLTGELATYFQAEDGLLVTDVAEGTPAGDAGLTPGDVIIAVRGRRVTTVDQLRSALSAAESTPLLTVLRRGRRLELRLPG